MDCRIYRNIHDVLARRADNPDALYVACDGERHWRFTPDGREYIKAEIVDGHAVLFRCPDAERSECTE